MNEMPTENITDPTITDATITDGAGPRRRSRLAIGVGAGLLAGSAIGFVAGVPGLTSAASDTPVVVDEPADDATTGQTDDTTSDDAPAGPAEGAPTGERLRETLQPLVDDGTIDAGQADAVSEYLAGEFAERVGDHRGGHRGHGPGPIRDGLDTVVDLLDIDAATLRDELRAGSSLADIATAAGVDPQTLIDALVAEAEAGLDQAVEDGRIDSELADERRDDLEERVTDLVNGVRPERPERLADADLGTDASTDTGTGT